MPKSLMDALNARTEALNARGEGRWSRNSVVVRALTKAAEEWEREAP